MQYFQNLFDDKRLLIFCLGMWTMISSITFVLIMIEDESTFLQFGPNSQNSLLGVVLDTWPKWWAVSVYTFISTCIAAFSGDSLFPFITNTVMDHKTKYIPYSKFTCLAIIQVHTVYGVCFSVIGTFVALSQVDQTLIRIAADMMINHFTTRWFLRCKVVDKDKYNQWHTLQKEEFNEDQELDDVDKLCCQSDEKKNEQKKLVTNTE